MVARRWGQYGNRLGLFGNVEIDVDFPLASSLFQEIEEKSSAIAPVMRFKEQQLAELATLFRKDCWIEQPSVVKWRRCLMGGEHFGHNATSELKPRNQL